jgi:hypothetical protein
VAAILEGGADPPPSLPATFFYSGRASQRLDTLSRPELLGLVCSYVLDGTTGDETLADVERSCRDKLDEESRLRQNLDDLMQEHRQLRRDLDLIRSSTSWRITAPARRAISAIRQAVRWGER